MSEHGANLSDEDKTSINEALTEAKAKLEESESAQSLKDAFEKLTQASHALAKKMYESASTEEGAEGAGAEGGEDANAESASADEDVVDADFEEVE